MYIASLKANGIQEQHFYSWTFANAEQNGDIQMAQKYVSQWEKAKEQNLGLLLWGGVGTGKTYIAAFIANPVPDDVVREKAEGMKPREKPAPDIEAR